MNARHPVTRRRPAAVARLLVALLLAAGLGALTVAPAQAAAYRFWGFFTESGTSWTFAQKGPDQTVPADGTVDGWRFAVADETSSRFPRATPTFDELCSTTPKQDGLKRVGLVVDFGRAADSESASTPPEPTARCASVPTQASSTDVLKSVGELRIEGGLVCAVSGYPASGCGGEVKEVSSAAAAADTPVQLTLPGAATSSAPATAAGQAVADGAAAGTSAGTVVAYVVAALAIVAVLVVVLLRSRARARRGEH